MHSLKLIITVQFQKANPNISFLSRYFMDKFWLYSQIHKKATVVFKRNASLIQRRGTLQSNLFLWKHYCFVSHLRSQLFCSVTWRLKVIWEKTTSGVTSLTIPLNFSLKSKWSLMFFVELLFTQFVLSYFTQLNQNLLESTSTHLYTTVRPSIIHCSSILH